MVRRLAADQEIYMSQWFRKAITKAAEEQYEHWGDDIDTKTAVNARSRINKHG